MCRFSGDPAGIRTPDPLLKRQLLCRLSYRIRVKHLLPINHRPRGRIHGQWQGRLDSNQRMRESKSLALPLGYAPKWKKEETGDTPAPSCLGWVMGLEPTTSALSIELHPPHIKTDQADAAQRAGTPGGTRTPGPLLRRQLLYPAELLAQIWSR